MAKSDIEMVQEMLRKSRKDGLDITTPRFVDVMGRPYHSIRRSLDIMSGYNDEPHGLAAAILPSENVSKVRVTSSVSPYNEKPLTFIRAEHYVPKTILLDKDESNPYSPESLHFWASRGYNSSKYEHLDPHDIHNLKQQYMFTHITGRDNPPQPDSPHIKDIHDFISSAHTAPTIGFVTPDDMRDVSSKRFMTPKDFAHFSAAMRAFPPEDLEHMVASGPMGFSPHFGVDEEPGYLGRQLPHGMIHVRKFNNINGVDTTVDHYHYDPSEESLNHIMTKEFN